jgi:hypothetical protein
VSTRSSGETPEAAPARRPRWPRRQRLEPLEEVALVARARRELLLRAHRHRLRREDLEDAYSQATLELLADARRGASYESRRDIETAIERRFVSRIRDRRRALAGRSPIQAALERSLSLTASVGEQEVDIVDARAELETLVIARMELRRAEVLIRELTPDHASWYVADVMRWAARYRAPTAAAVEASAGSGGSEWSSPTQIRFVRGERAVLDPLDRHLALLPEGAPPVVQAMVVAGNELQQLPYGPGGHPDPRGALEEDCSSTVNYVLYRSGVRPIAEIVADNPLARDYTRWGAPGPGRWVTIYATTRPSEHVFIVIAGLRLDTSHNGTDVGPNRGEDGPRWRLLDHIPTWAAWSIRHPPGL